SRLSPSTGRPSPSRMESLFAVLAALIAASFVCLGCKAPKKSSDMPVRRSPLLAPCSSSVQKQETPPSSIVQGCHFCRFYFLTLSAIRTARISRNSQVDQLRVFPSVTG
ncbi:hypothetical protein PENTCL1PPCAC_26223, partial [Pristionchus entomophagus]